MDKLHGNYFIYNLFEPDANHRHKNFKAFFACQKNLIKPTQKIRIGGCCLFFMSTKCIFPLIWMLGFTVSIDEMTIHFIGHDAGKNDDLQSKR